MSTSLLLTIAVASVLLLLILVIKAKVHPFVAPIVSAVAIQLLAYHTAAHLGADVDQPRNLAKSVTVE